MLNNQALDDDDFMSDHYLSLRSYILEDFKALTALVVFAIATGLLIKQLVFCLMLAFLGFVVLQFYALFRIHRWIRTSPYDPPPVINGVWGAVLLNLYRSQRRERLAHAELLGFIDRAQASVMALEEAVVLINTDYCLEWWNPAAQRLLGFLPSDRNRNILTIIRQPNFSEYFNNINKFASGIVLDSTFSGGRHIHCKLTLFGDDNRLLVAHDVSHVQRLEQMRTDFIGNISHELRTPLTVISGYLETFLELQDGQQSRYKRAFEQMQQQTRRMNSLVNDLLLLSRLENEPAKAKTQLISVADLLSQLYDEAQGYNNDYGHSIELEVDSHFDLVGAEMEIASAFSNLITNAIKYTPKQGRIHIRWFDDAEKGYFSVQDNGIGIESHHVKRITERFYRVDSARSRESGGTGLGLAIVKHVLVQHDAVLEITSTPNEGSTFKAIFPRSRLYNLEYDE